MRTVIDGDVLCCDGAADIREGWAEAIGVDVGRVDDCGRERFCGVDLCWRLLVVGLGALPACFGVLDDFWVFLLLVRDRCVGGFLALVDVDDNLFCVCEAKTVG